MLRLRLGIIAFLDAFAVPFFAGRTATIESSGSKTNTMEESLVTTYQPTHETRGRGRPLAVTGR